MKRFSFLALVLIMMTALSALAAPRPSTEKAPAFPGTLANARYVYVASYDGDQFNTNLRPEDRAAIGAVQDAIQNWGKLALVYQPSQADIIILVTSWPSEDLLAVYDAHGPRGNYLWRVMGRDGLESGETPLVTQFEKGLESVQNHK
jgi:hypothetical protein